MKNRSGKVGLFKKKKEIKNDVVYSADLLEAIFGEDNFSRETAMSLPAVAGAVDKITSTVAMIPIKLYKESEVNGKRVVEEVKDKRVALLNEDTKSTLDGFQFKKAIVEDYLMGKGGYAYIKRRRNDFIGLYYVKDDEVAFSLFDPNPLQRRYKIYVWDGEFEPYEYLKVLRNSKDGMYGVGITNEIGKALNTMFQTMVLQLNLARTGGNKRGFIQSENVLSKEAIENLKDAWQQMYANNDTQRIPVLNKGLSFKESSATSTEMQLNETKKQFDEEIAKMFHVDGDYNEFFKNAVQPILTAFETALNRDFLLEKEKDTLFWAFDTSDITKGNIKERYEAYKLALESGWMTKNEARYRENMDAIDGLDTINMGLGSVLYDTKTGEYFIPNTNTVYKAGETTQKDDTNMQKVDTNVQKDDTNVAENEQNVQETEQNVQKNEQGEQK